jgi:hypothetical protein
VIVVVGDLAVETIEAFVHIDLPAAFDGTYRAHGLTEMAAAAALGVPFQ